MTRLKGDIIFRCGDYSVQCLTICQSQPLLMKESYVCMVVYLLSCTQLAKSTPLKDQQLYPMKDFYVIFFGLIPTTMKSDGMTMDEAFHLRLDPMS